LTTLHVDQTIRRPDVDAPLRRHEWRTRRRIAIRRPRHRRGGRNAFVVGRLARVLWVASLRVWTGHLCASEDVDGALERIEVSGGSAGAGERVEAVGGGARDDEAMRRRGATRR